MTPVCTCERDCLETPLWNLRQYQSGKTVFGVLSRFTESVSNVRIREEVFWIRRIVLDLHSNLPDERAQVLELVSVFRPPYRPQ